MIEIQKLKQRGYLVTDAQAEWLDAQAKKRGGRPANVSASSILRELINAQMTKKKS